MTIILAIILGTAFGFALDQAKASNPEKIINMLRLKDFHLMKVILFAIGFSSFLLFILLAINIINPSHISIKSSYIGVIVGGAILGVGFAIGGYCPGTSVVAAGRGRIDAIMFIAGGLLGALVYMLLFETIEDSLLFNQIGGTLSLVETNTSKFQALIKNVPAIYIAGPIAIIFMLIAFLLPTSKNE